MKLVLIWCMCVDDAYKYNIIKLESNQKIILFSAFV